MAILPAGLRPGLRAQIVAALLLVFVFSFALLGSATVRLTQRAAQLERVHTAELVAEALLADLSGATHLDGDNLGRLIEGHTRHAPMAAVAVRWPDGRERVFGRKTGAPAASSTGSDGLRVQLWTHPVDSHQSLPLSRLLLFYVLFTGFAVMVLAYVALTRLIVRPVAALTRSSERLAAGHDDVRVAETGAAEVHRLAVAFNEMATQLRGERNALQTRLEELEKTTVELQTTQQQLIHGEKLASVGRLAAGVAHEIGNPLAAILGFVQLLRGGQLDGEETREFLERIQSETERINGIIRDLLDFSRRDAEENLSGQTADPLVVVQDAVNLVRPQKEARRVRFDVQADDSVGRVVGPQHRLTQVVLNILLNAVDAMGGDGEVRISIAAEGDRVSISVQDTGPGIRADIMDHLFEPFATTKEVGKGTGLGLAVCHALVTGMGGTIVADNVEPGARVLISLVAAPRSTPAPPPNS